MREAIHIAQRNWGTFMRKGYLTITFGYADKGKVLFVVQICILSLSLKI